MAKRKEVKYSLPQIKYDSLKEYIEVVDDLNVTDDNYVSGSFLSQLDNKNLKYRDYIYKSSADAEFMDTSLGGHVAVNMPYGFTRFADIPNKGRDMTRGDFVNNKFSPTLGPGRFYAESIMRFSKPRILHLQLGVPSHRSMFSFFTEAISFRESVIANEGRTTFFYDLGVGVGALGLALAFPIQAGFIYLAKGATELFFGEADPRYYTFKSTMHNYALAANSILKSAMIERGLIRLEVDNNSIEKSKEQYGANVKISKDLYSELEKAIPYIFNTLGEIDIMRVVSRPQILVNRMLAFEREVLLSGKTDKMPDLDEFNDAGDATLGEFISRVSRINTFKNNLDDDNRKKIDTTVPTSSANIDAKEYDKRDPDTGAKKRLPHDKTSWSEDFSKYFNVVRNMGFEEVGFYVDYVGSSSYSFTNETKDIPAKGMINSVGGASRDAYFSLSGGNVLGDTVDGILKAGRDVAMGTLSTASFGLSNALSVLVAGGYISFPKMWSDSSVSLPSHTFKMTLGGPYGNALSSVMDIDVPLSMILAAALPISVGRASYTSPFLCKAFVQGVTDIDFGMITSLTITSSTGVIGRTIDTSAIQVEVQFTITDFTDIVTARVSDGLLGAYWLQFDEAGALNRILRGIAGRSYRNSRYVGKGFRYRVAAIKSSVSSVIDPARVASWASDSILTEIVKIGNIDNKASSIFSH